MFALQEVVCVEKNRPLLKPVEAPSERKQGIQLDQKAVNVLLPSFVCGIFGGPGAGKSSLLEHLLKDSDIFGQRFERVLFVGPTIYGQLIQDSHNHHRLLDIGWIFEKIKQANEWKCRSMLIIFDDVISSIKDAKGTNFVDLFFNRRHLLTYGTINIILTAQKWNMVPVFIRTILNMIITFPMSKQQLQVMAKQTNLPIQRKTFIQLMGSLKKHHFIYINIENNKLFNWKWEEI